MKFLNILRAAAATALISMALTAAAAGSATGNITQIVPQYNGHLLVYVSGAITGAPSCASSATSFAVDATSTTGKPMAAAIFLAFTAHMAITVVGTGACDVESTHETVSYAPITN